MHQIIEGKSVEVVDFDTMPELPITGLTQAEAAYENMLSFARGFWNPLQDPRYRRNGRYAEALTDAIENGIITEPGKYGIHFIAGTDDYEIFKIIE